MQPDVTEEDDGPPLITTVLTTYRRPALLRRAIKSVLAQTFKRLRVCVYDDASGDGTGDIVRYLAEEDPRVEYYEHPINVGAPANFDFGVRNVKTAFFSILADDDVLLPDFYERALAQFNTEPSAMVVIRETIYIGLDHMYFGSSTAVFAPGFYEHPEGLLAMCRHPQPCWSGALFRKEVIEQVGTLDTTLFSMDYDFMLRVAAVCPYVISHEPGVMFTVHPGQSTAVLRLHMVWPTRYAAIEKIAGDERISQSVRQQAVEILKTDLTRLLFFIGLRALTLNKIEECKTTAAILADKLGNRRKQIALLATAALIRLHPASRRILLWLHSLRRRKLHEKQPPPPLFRHYCEYYDFLSLG